MISRLKIYQTIKNVAIKVITISLVHRNSRYTSQKFRTLNNYSQDPNRKLYCYIRILLYQEVIDNVCRDVNIPDVTFDVAFDYEKYKQTLFKFSSVFVSLSHNRNVIFPRTFEGYSHKCILKVFSRFSFLLEGSTNCHPKCRLK